MLKRGDEFDAKRGMDAINDNRETLLFVLGRYFHPQTTCAELSEKCVRLDDTFQLLKRNFKREERIMTAAGYLDIDQHSQEHRYLLDHLARMRDEMSCSRYDNLRVAKFLYQWTQNHARTFDGEFAAYLQIDDMKTAADGRY